MATEAISPPRLLNEDCMLIDPLSCWSLLNEDCVLTVASKVSPFDTKDLARCVRVCKHWQRIFGPILASLPRRVQASIVELESSECLRRATLWRERRRALASSLEGEGLELWHRCQSEPAAGAAAIVNAAFALAWREQTPHVARVHACTGGISGTRPAASAEDLRDWTRAQAVLEAPAEFIHALRNADAARVDLSTLLLVRGLTSEPFFAPVVGPRAALNLLAVLVRWSLAMLDEASFFAADEEARAADEELRALVATARRCYAASRQRAAVSKAKVMRSGTDKGIGRGRHAVAEGENWCAPVDEIFFPKPGDRYGFI